jgi:hypothetical protein
MSNTDPIDDSFRTHPIVMALDRTLRKVACCPKDGEPLVSTFERAGAEFHCVVCRGWFGWLAPVGKTETPELMARCQELTTQYDTERKARAAASGETTP